MTNVFVRKCARSRAAETQGFYEPYSSTVLISLLVLPTLESPKIWQTLDCCHGKHWESATAKKNFGSGPGDALKALLPKRALEVAGTSWRWPQVIFKIRIKSAWVLGTWSRLRTSFSYLWPFMNCSSAKAKPRNMINRVHRWLTPTDAHSFSEQMALKVVLLAVKTPALSTLGY